MRKILCVLLALSFVLSVAGMVFADSDAQTKKIIISPGDLKIEVWLDRSSKVYTVGDDIKVFFRTNRDAFVTLFDIDPSGNVQLLFPSDRYGDNFVVANRTYELPAGGQQYHVSGPGGTEIIYAVASLYYTQFHQQFNNWDARTLHTRVIDTLKRYPRSRWDIVKTEFTVRDREPYPRRELRVQAIESGVMIYLDGEYKGDSPINLTLPPGEHQVVAMKEGYRIDVREISARDDFYSSTWIPQLQRLPSPYPSSGSSNWLDWLNIEFKFNL